MTATVPGVPAHESEAFDHDREPIPGCATRGRCHSRYAQPPIAHVPMCVIHRLERILRQCCWAFLTISPILGSVPATKVNDYRLEGGSFVRFVDCKSTASPPGSSCCHGRDFQRPCAGKHVRADSSSRKVIVPQHVVDKGSARMWSHSILRQ